MSGPSFKNLPQHLPKLSVGTYLLALALAIALPMLAFIVIILWQLQSSEDAALLRRTERTAETVARSAANQLRDMAVTVRLLTSAPELEERDLAQFHARTQSALRQNGWFLIVVDKDGQQLLNTRVPYGTALGKTSNMQSLDAALKGKRTVVSNAFFGQTSKRWVFNIIHPLPLNLPSRAAAVILTQDVSNIAGMFDNDQLPKDWHAALIDGSGHVVVATDRMASGAPFTLYPPSRFSDFEGSFSDDTTTDQVVGYAQLPGWSWKAIVWGPVEAAQEHFQNVWRTLIVGGAVLLGVALLAAFAVGRYLRKSIVNVSDMAQSMGRGEIVSPARSQIVEVDNVATAISDASYDRSLAEDRIHLIMRELSHRTKNLITVIHAMMRQSAKGNTNVADFQSAMAGRLQGLSHSIDLLTAQQWSAVSMRLLVERQMETIADSKSRFALIGEDFQVTPDAVQSFGMILHELATNATKYGALSTPNGKVIIQWIDDPSSPDRPTFLFTWSEVGDTNSSSEDNKGFGSRLIEATIASLSGSAHVDQLADGWKWTIKAPWEKVVVTAQPDQRPPDTRKAGAINNPTLTAKPAPGH